jgi:uncharacterized protein
MRKGAALFLLLLPAVLWAAKAIPPAPRTYVLNEGVILPETEARLSATLSAFEQGTGRQFAVALFQSLDGEDLDDYSNRLFRAWKLGDAKTNDGLLFCLYKQDRKWRVEVGYGLEGVMTDLSAGQIARDQGVPHFKNGDFDGGVLAVVDALGAKLQGQEVPPPARADDSGRLSGAGLALVFFVVILLLRLKLSSYGINSGGYWGGGFMGGGWGGGGGSGFGGFSGGGGSSGGGGASGGW